MDVIYVSDSEEEEEEDPIEEVPSPRSGHIEGGRWDGGEQQQGVAMEVCDLVTSDDSDCDPIEPVTESSSEDCAE